MNIFIHKRKENGTQFPPNTPNLQMDSDLNKEDQNWTTVQEASGSSTAPPQWEKN